MSLTLFPLGSGGGSGGGSVNSVSGTSPIVSSGGDDPVISLSLTDTGAVLFSDGTTAAQDSVNFFWDATNKRLGIGTNAPTSALHVIGEAFVNNVLPDDTGGEAAEFSVSSHTTVSGSNTTIAFQSVATAIVDTGAVNDKGVAGAANTVTRGNGSDDGNLSALGGVQNLIFHNTSSLGTTDVTIGCLNLMFTIGGTQDNYYGFRDIRVPAGSGVINNHYGVYIDNDSTTPVKNWLSGKTLLGGSSFTDPVDALVVNGDLTVNGLIHSTDTNNSIDSNNRLLVNSSGATVLDWSTGIGFFGATPATQQTGGAATAGALYTATEQGMLQTVYDALRTFGLLS